MDPRNPIPPPPPGHLNTTNIAQDIIDGATNIFQSPISNTNDNNISRDRGPKKSPSKAAS
ncbi:9777_t:CDS:2 [Ambispora gerdemannii]|uniref:9777_t:CDS:1 n=1 Tax=Ambispora gerdemannii TaxID=144530 RepID=A0A9N9F0H3_9GLOM|nr:9777_t:CDS:2 [Ambispora gerdemannii]